MQNFIKANDVPPVLGQEIVEHFEIITAQSKGKSDSIEDSIDIFSMLSHSLQVEVARNISHALVESCYVFDGCDNNFLDSICVLLREVTHNLRLRIEMMAFCPIYPPTHHCRILYHFRTFTVCKTLSSHVVGNSSTGELSFSDE